MTLEELRALFSDMLSKDMRPMLCDTEIPLYDTSVPCGEPTMGYSDLVETELLPKELLSMHPEFMVPVRGDSMKDAGIVTGDIVKVIADVTLYDGDIVLACIDGEYTLKSYCEDEDGLHWLVPQNDNYSPILLDGKTNVRIYGRVKEIVKTAPRVAYRQCMEAIRKMKKAMTIEPAITPQQVDIYGVKSEKDTETWEPDAEAVDKCFKFKGDFVIQSVRDLVTDFYHGNNANLALMEVTLFHHQQLKRRNSHKAFVMALAAWNLLSIADDEEFGKMVRGIMDKYRRLPEEGYKAWDDHHKLDRQACERMGGKLGPTMKYQG
ncbi:MAG: hypothetical protein IJ588_06410 [Prevotella sp.]|nr:hypothetical protein [Prevotella sp.]